MPKLPVKKNKLSALMIKGSNKSKKILKKQAKKKKK